MPTPEKTFPIKDIRFSLGQGYNLGKSKNHSESLIKFMQRFAAPVVTNEKFHEYKALNDKKQAYLKGTAGWFMRAHVEDGKRTRNSIKAGDLITLDADYATPEFVERLLAGELLPDVCLFAHSTRSSTPENPRLRIAIPLSEPLPPEQYQAACRIVAQIVDPEMTALDKVSARVAQMMYMPTVSSDMEKHYVFHQQKGVLADWKKAIRKWEKKNGSALDIANLPRFPGESELRESAEKAEDPLEKDGPIGTFCRTYSISELVEGKDGEDPILGEDYEITEYHEGTATRMTYIKGTTSNGAVVYDDKFVYSHHGSDPAQDKLLNAYDLVRYHLFDALGDDEDAPMGQKDSIKKINKWMTDQPAYKVQNVNEQYDLNEMFSDDDDMSWMDDGTGEDFDHIAAEERMKIEAGSHREAEDLLGMPIEKIEVPRYKRRRAPKAPENWVANELELKQDGTIAATLTNVATIVTYDPRVFGKISYNEFSHQVVLTADIKTKSKVIPPVHCTDKQKGMPWTDIYDITIRAIIEAENGRGKPGYGFQVQDRNIQQGITLAARNNAFHPIKELLADARETIWDGEDRISSFLHDHVGAEQNEYTAAIFRTKLLASIARIERPGCKFDYAIILEGAQGIGKSTLIKILYGEDYFGEIDVDLGNRQEVAEQMAGKWVMELPELSSLHKADHNAAKSFMRRQHDDVRMAYGRSVTQLPRQCIFWGTTNDSKYLRDPSGNRSYWPVKCSPKPINFLRVLRERDQVWAQAVREFDEMAAKYTSGDMPLTLTGEALQAAQVLQENARSKEMWEDWLSKVVEWAERPLTRISLSADMGWEIDPGEDEDDLLNRVAFTQGMAAQGALEFKDGTFHNAMHQAAWEKVKSVLTDRGYLFERRRVRTKVQRWIILPEMTEDQLRDGFIRTDEAEPREIPEDNIPPVADDESLI